MEELEMHRMTSELPRILKGTLHTHVLTTEPQNVACFTLRSEVFEMQGS